MRLFSVSVHLLGRRAQNTYASIRRCSEKRGKEIMSKKTMSMEYVRATKDVQRMGQTSNYVINVVANFKTKDGQELPPEYSEVLLFGEAAQKFGNPESPSCIKKGQSLNVTGRFQLNRWIDKKGKDQINEQIVVSDVNAITLNVGKSSSGNSANSVPAPVDFSEDDESPFC